MSVPTTPQTYDPNATRPIPPVHSPYPPSHGQPPYPPHPGRPGPLPHQGPPAFSRPVPAPRSSRLPSAAEVLGWSGGLTTVFGVIAVTWDFWSLVPDVVLVGLLVLATLVLGVAGTVVGGLDRGDDDRLAANLSVGLWWMTGITASVTTYVAADVVSGGRAYLPLVAAAGAATAMFAAAAHRTGRDSALAGAILSASVTAFAAAGLASLPAPGPAVAVWAVGLAAAVGLALWSRTAARGSFAISLMILFGGSQAVLASDFPTVGVITVLAGMITAGAVAVWRRRTGEGIAAAGLAGVVACEVLYELAPQAVSLSTLVLLTGIAMTVGCIHLVRRASRAGDAGEVSRGQ